VGYTSAGREATAIGGANFAYRFERICLKFTEGEFEQGVYGTKLDTLCYLYEMAY